MTFTWTTTEAEDKALAWLLGVQNAARASRGDSLLPDIQALMAFEQKCRMDVIGRSYADAVDPTGILEAARKSDAATLAAVRALLKLS